MSPTIRSLLLFGVSVPVLAQAADTVSFNEKIQPILSEYCYQCHGPDSGTREPKKSPLRLDRKADAFAPRDGDKPVLIPGDAANSEVMKRILTKDEDDIMPPPKSHKKMKPEEIALLKQWITQGAKYEDHWAFLPVKKPEIPTAGKGWAANPIDNFIAEKLESAKLAPNPPEDVRRFYRRLSFDLTGLPPNVEDTDAFAKAASTNTQTAIESAADKMMASMASAEHFTRQWLDAARYADTHGIHIDNFRNIWPYRDWVIGAFQKNMPWDQFTVEQTAGDLLPDATTDQKIATGFLRCLPTTGEGGAIAEEYFAIYAKDRVDTTAAIWLGLTTGCASCHDHKFDPVSTKDFYSLTAFFRNSTMSALDGNRASHKPVMFAPALEDRPKWNSIDVDVDSIDKQVTERANTAKADFEKWLPTFKIAMPSDAPGVVAHLPMLESEGPAFGRVAGQPYVFSGAVQRREGATGQALRADSAVIDLGNIAELKRQDKLTVSTFIYVDGAPTGAVIARMAGKPGHRGWDVFLEAGRVSTHVTDTWPTNASKISTTEALAPGKWHHLAVVFDGSDPKLSTIYLNGAPAATKVDQASLTAEANLQSDVPLLIGSRAGNDSKLKGVVALQDLRIFSKVLTPAEVTKLGAKPTHPSGSLSAADIRREPKLNDALYQYYLTNHDKTSLELRQKKDALVASKAQMKGRGSDVLIMDEKRDEPFAHILTRGEYTAKADRVGPNTPAALPPMAADAPKNRLGLAKWLVDPANPLPARVTVNRVWAYLMGTGIVETTDDFGLMGARPTHPKLLDWLASSFVESKWDYRRLVKAIVSSATYRQSGKLNAKKLEADPFNRLLSRGPRYRLDAEPLRDMALIASGLLVPKVGGPPVRPYQPEGIWESVAMKESNTKNYKQDSGDALYRRSLYTIWKRIAPHPSMEILNAPSREVTCTRRERTNTPLQAFVMLNDPQLVEAAKFLAANAMKSSTDFNQRLDHLTQRLISRAFAENERTIVKKTYDEALKKYQAEAPEAAKLLGIGAKPAPADLPAPELAAWTFVASQILNLDETLNK